MSKRLKVGQIFCWQPILGDDYLRAEFRLEPFIVADIKDKKLTSFIVSNLQEIYPLSNILKYKRVRVNKSNSLQVLITEKKKFNGLSDKLNSNLDNFQELELPVDRVLTRRQYDLIAAKYWPMQFHSDKRIESLIDKSFEKIEENLILRSDFYSRLLLDLAQHYKSCAAALIVDPKNDRIVASGIFFKGLNFSFNTHQ